MKKISLQNFNLDNSLLLSRNEKKNTIGGAIPPECYEIICDCGTYQYSTSCDAGCPGDCWMGPSNPMCWQYDWPPM